MLLIEHPLTEPSLFYNRNYHKEYLFVYLKIFLYVILGWVLLQ